MNENEYENESSEMNNHNKQWRRPMPILFKHI